MNLAQLVVDNALAVLMQSSSDSKDDAGHDRGPDAIGERTSLVALVEVPDLRRQLVYVVVAVG